MGCCPSSPHSRRRYRDPADLDECYIPEDELPLHQGNQNGNGDRSIGPLRTFGRYRPNSVWVPDDIDGLPSTHMDDGRHLASDPNTLLFSAEIDNGRAFRCIRPLCLFWLAPPTWPFLLANGLGRIFDFCTCDEICCWVRKEYMKRNFYHVYPNRIETNDVKCRFFGMCGCGSWNSDDIVAHPFDRGAFGFRPVSCGDAGLVFCLWPLYGGVVARQRCQCNGPLWYGCDGWWCDEWLCDVMCCSYRYANLTNPEEVAAASSIALQAYFEGRKITAEDMDKCLEFWRENISEEYDPIARKRDVCCEPLAIPCPSGIRLYRCVCQPSRNPPYALEANQTQELEKVYDDYRESRQRQLDRYESFIRPVQKNTYCKMHGRRRLFGRRGVIFCTEGCFSFKRGPGEPFPPYQNRDIDDDNNASKILQTVLGNPPANVQYRMWELAQGPDKRYEIQTHPNSNSLTNRLSSVPQDSSFDNNESTWAGLVSGTATAVDTTSL